MAKVEIKTKNKASKIMECCKYTRNSAFGYKWKYIEFMIIYNIINW